MFRQLTAVTCANPLLLAALAFFSSGTVSAGETKLECTLYIAQSMDSVASHKVSIEGANETLATLRRSGVCVFANGDVADKQFVMINRITEGGKQGSTRGFSTYTLPNGDSIITEFSGGWQEGPFKGTYTILGGTGAYANAKGAGTIAGTDSPWNTTNIVNIVLKVTTP